MSLFSIEINAFLEIEITLRSKELRDPVYEEGTEIQTNQMSLDTLLEGLVGSLFTLCFEGVVQCGFILDSGIIELILL